MGRKIIILVVVSLFVISVRGQADFKYTQTSQITGGAMAGMVHALGMFSKRLREPMPSTTYVKGDYLRTDEADGSYQIIDLSGQRIIHVDPKKNSYSVATFEQMREAMQKASERMNQQAHSASQDKNGDTNVTVTPKIEVNPTGRTQTLLGQNAQEVNMKVELEMQATDQTHGTQKGSLNTVVDSWIASSVSGYEEVSNFYKKMASEIGWTPGNFGFDPRVRKSMAELYKGGKIPQGMPLLQVISLTGEGQTPPPQQGAAQQQQPSQSQDSSQQASTPSEAAAKAIGGMFGGFGRFGHKKKKQQDEDQQASSDASAPANNSAAANSTASNSLMEMTIRVTAYSTDPVDASLFQIPAGYTQVKSDVERMVQSSR